ncbi:GTPase IMAP family member 8-like [Anableps anableps]
MEDEGSYCCKAEQKGSNTTKEGCVTLNVSELTPPSITLTPISRQVFSGDYFTIHCPASQKNSSSWQLMHFSSGKSHGINQGQIMSPLGETGSATLQEKRIILIGGRWSGKSWSGNTILGGERFECGRARTTKVEVRHGEVEGSKLTVVDTPGWSSSLSLIDIPEGEKQSFKLYASKSPPGPHVFLLIIPIDSAFTQEERTTLEEHMKLLGKRVWRFIMVLFTCGDYLGEKTIEQHIESEGDSLKWLIGRCRNRYHVFHNKDKENLSQVSELLEKIDEMIKNNDGAYYKIDEQTFQIITRKKEDVARRAKERRSKAEEQRQQRIKLISEDMKSIPKLQMILLGSRNVGKTSVGNTLLGFKEQEDGKRTAKSLIRSGFVDETDVTLVDTPGWWKGFPACDTPEAMKEEIIKSMFLCPPGPHIFLLVIDADASFHNKNLKAVTSHLELLGEGVWKHTVIVFTRGDWLVAKSIEEYIEGEGEALQSLVDLCDNRYHVINNKNASDRGQITEMMEKITETVAENSWKYFVPDQQLNVHIEERRKCVEEAAMLRQKQVKAMRSSAGSRKRLDVLRVLLLGQKSCGKSATGNTILRKEVFVMCQNEECKVENGMVDGKQITVIDTPGWWKECSHCTEEMDKEIARGMSLSPSGVHAVLLVVPFIPTFKDPERVAVKEHMNLFGASIWKHTIVLFTHGDNLEDKSVEEHIEREHQSLRWLVDKCENRYHTINNMKKGDKTQVTELFEKIEEMVAGNGGQLFCPDMEETHQRISEKAHKRQLKNVLKQQLEREYRRRELELLMGLKGTLLELQAESRASAVATKPKLPIGDVTNIKARIIGHRKKDNKVEEKELEGKITKEIEKLDKEIMKSSTFLQSSMDALFPDLAGESSTQSIVCSSSDPKISSTNFDRVLGWLSNLHVTTNLDNQLTVNFSDTSGYRSVLSVDNDKDSIINE